MYTDGVQNATWGDVMAIFAVAVYVIVTLGIVAGGGSALAVPRRVLA